MKPQLLRNSLLATLLAAATFASAEVAAAGAPLVLRDHGVFFVEGEYVPSGNDEIMAGQMYVEYFEPLAKRHPYPVVMIHGGGQTGVNFLKTPDGRDGWVHHFVRGGYKVYVVDQPARGRSAYRPSVDGNLSGNTAIGIAQRFTAPETFPDTWPQALLHTQWPGTGLPGDPWFDQFYASQVEGAGMPEARIRPALAKLLDQIGPAIIMTHSQSGPFGWIAAEERPDLVKGIVALEPSGPPFENAPPPWSGGGAARAWGVTETPMTYDPPVTDPSELNIITEDAPQGPDLVTCKRQAEPARQLVNLRGIPILIYAAEASYHAAYDHCTAQYIAQAGGDVDFIRLEDIGIHGNGHMIMLELNNADTAKFMMDWIRDNVR